MLRSPLVFHVVVSRIFAAQDLLFKDELKRRPFT